MDWNFDGYSVSTDKNRLQIERIHRHLSTEAYWCLGIPEITVRKAIEGSLCFGLYKETGGKNLQIGFARVVTDQATFAWLCDVYIDKEERGKGLSKNLMSCIMSHPDLQNLRRFCLATRGTHGLYEKFGFQVTKTPEYWMEIKTP